MRAISRRRFLALLPPAAVAAVLTRTSAPGLISAQADSPGEWVYLSDIDWDDASTGWLGVANQQVPARDGAFHGGPLSLAGQVYAKGIGVYPLSEITYSLDGAYLQFACEIGLDDVTWNDDVSARFLVFVDGVLKFESGDVFPRTPPARVEVDVTEARNLRLVVDAPPDKTKRAFADWAAACLLKPSVPPAASLSSVPQRNRSQSQDAHRQADEDDVLRRGRALLAALPTYMRRSHGGDERPGAFVDRFGHRLWLSTGRAALALSWDRASYSAISLIDLQTQRPVVLEASGGVTLGGQYLLRQDTKPVGFRPYEFLPFDDPTLGLGVQVVLHSVTHDERWHIDLRCALFANDTVLYDIAITGARAAAVPAGFQHFAFQPDAGSLWVDDDAQYLSDYSRLRYGHLYADGILRREPVGEGKPLFIWSDRRQRGLLMALLDHTYGATRFQAQVPVGRAQARWGLDSGAAVMQELRSARLYMEITKTSDLRYAFSGLRTYLDATVPEATFPTWFKFQWLSWYCYGMSNDAEAVQRQGDYIAANLADLGPWNTLVDAGWYICEGRDESDWHAVDEVKFPGGMRPIVDHLHEQGIWVVLYLSVPYIDSIVEPGYWLGMRGIIEKHPDWLRLLGSTGDRQSYSFDFKNPDVLAYWASVMEDFFVRHGVDGIKIDGVGNAEGAILSPDKLDAFGLVDDVNEQTMEIYRFFYREVMRHRADGYIETGWLTPIFSRPYVHTFRYGDEAPRFSSPYPFPGLAEHIAYAIIQKEILGLKPNMGAIYDNPNSSVINRWWLAAGLALGAHVTLGFDLAGMTTETLSAYRSLLAHYEPFTGTTTYGPGIRPRTFATTRSGTTYLGILNTGRSTRSIQVPLADHKLDVSRPMTAYDMQENRFLRLPNPLAVAMSPKSFRFYVIRQDPGVLWTNSAFSVQQSDGRLDVTLTGPSSLEGFAHLSTPAPLYVEFDGQDLLDADNPAILVLYRYAEETGILSVYYGNSPHGHHLVIGF